MVEFGLATVVEDGRGVAAVIAGEDVLRVPGDRPVRALLEKWETAEAQLREQLEAGNLDRIGAVDRVRLGPPVPDAPNLYMAGANYADHAREMRKLGPDDPVPRPERGPFMFLKSTSTLVGPGDEVRIAPGCRRLDWEVELAAVIGRHAHRLPIGRALDAVAGYTVANDISARGNFVRDDTAEPPMKFDWFWQKSWATSLPMGPWLVPASELPDPQALTLRLRVNDTLEQESSTAEMIFSTAELIAFVSAIVPLRPGDVICTGTPAGVGTGKERFLSPGDVMEAEVEEIGRLKNPVVEG